MTSNPFPDWQKESGIKDQKLPDYSKDQTLETFETEDTKAKKTISSFITGRKIQAMYLFIFVCLVFLFGRLFYLQIVQGEEYRLQAEDNRIRVQSMTATRGAILDKNNNILAKNIPTFSLVATSADLPQNEAELGQLIKTLAYHLEINEKEIRDAMDKLSNWSYQPVIIIEQIDYSKALRLETISSELAGVSVIIEARREYPYQGIAAHLMGYTGRINAEEKFLVKEGYAMTDWLGKTGIEKYYEETLKGTNGKKQIEVNSLGKEQEVLAVEEPESGQNIVLTIDIELQQKLMEELESAIGSSSATGGAAVAIDPRNGEVLALVSLPSFDNNLFINGLSEEQFDQIFNNPEQPLFFRTISGEFPSGSTIKPFIAAAALEEGIINSNTTVNSTGGIRIGQWFFPDWKSGGHGVTNVTKAIAESVNTFFYMIGGGTEEEKYEDGMGVDTINSWLEKFGFNNKTNIDLPSESDGFLPTPNWKQEIKGEKWYIGDTYHLAIGQGDLLATPLQIANAYAVFANGGTLYQPHLFKESKDNDDNLMSQPEPVILNDGFLSSTSVNIVKQGLRQAVLDGSARRMQSLVVSSAAKTGTAQFGNEDKTHAWFATFAPYENPEIVMTIFLEEGGEGSDTALPVALNTLNWYFTQ